MVFAFLRSKSSRAMRPASIVLPNPVSSAMKRLTRGRSSVGAVLTTCVVVLRYGFDIGSIATQETVTYMHGCVFLLGAAYALKEGAHVRVDIFYRYFSARTRACMVAISRSICAAVALP